MRFLPCYLGKKLNLKGKYNMALCANAANPSATITNGLQLFIDSPWGEDGGFEGDYSVAGVGTRKNGTGVIKLKSIPDGAEVFGAYIIYNTYQANTPVAHPVVTLNGQDVTGNLYGICGSTCWINPVNELTTYLRNRVYIKDISSLGIVEGNGNYTVAGLPTTPAMRIATDGDRIPGCLCSQGAILFVLWEWGSGPSPEDPAIRARAVNMYLGARLLSNNGTFGAFPTYDLKFQPVQDTTDNNFFKGNSHIEIAAGDAQNSIPGDSFAINQVQFIPPNNAFTKIGSSLCVRKFSVAQIYDGNNSAFAKTTNDCIDWFFFAISGDKTQPKSQFQIVNCVATYLLEDAQPEETTITVYSNFTQTPQTLPGGACRAVAYRPPLVGPPAPGMPLPPSNPPGMFPAAKPGSYYIKIDNEIMKVTAKDDPDGPGPPIQPGPPDKTKWTVERGQAGTTPAFHKKTTDETVEKATCVYMLSPPRFISEIQAALAAKGQPKQRPDARRPAGLQPPRRRR
jgi:hypothetical protein